MMRAINVTSPAIWALALLLCSAGAAMAQQPIDKVMMPWQKPQAKPHPPADFTEILPWLLPDGGAKSANAQKPAVWTAHVAEPAAPVEPGVIDFDTDDRRLETGTVSPTGLVLKKPLSPVKAAAAPAAKIKNSVALPGDAPVGQVTANEVPSDSSDVAEPAAADEAAAVQPPMAKPIDADEARAAAPAEQSLNSWAPAEGARPVEGKTEQATEAAAVPVEAAAVAGEAAAAHNVGAPLATAAKPGLPTGTAKHVGAPEAGHTVTGRTETAQSVAAPAVEGAPVMPQAEEAPPIPDVLPDALVTPVAKPADTILPSQRAKELTDAAASDEGVPKDAQSKPRMPDKLAEGASVAQQYCFNIADAAKDARYAWQKKTLADIELELKKRIALLDERTAEYQKWLARRDEFIRNAEENVVKIYAGMKVDAAAVQLALMNEEAAAAVLAKLNTRNASAILNEMEAAKAAKLTMIITGAAKLKRKKDLQKSMTTQGENVAPGAGRSDGGRS